MQRKQFLITTLTATPLLAFSHFIKRESRNPRAFKIDVGKSRFNEKITFRGVNLIDFKISGKDTNTQLSVLAYSGKEKIGPPLHVHFEQEEMFYITEGSYRFLVGKEEMVLGKGDTVFLPRNIPHTWLQLTDNGEFICLMQPAGKMEEFFRSLNSLTEPPTEAEIQKIHLAHGMKVLGPPLTL